MPFDKELNFFISSTRYQM